MLALDIGSRFVKTCVLAAKQPDEGGIELEKYSIVPMPEGALNNTFSDRPFANPEAVKNTVREAVKQVGGKGMYVFVTIPDNLVVVNWMTMPVKSKEAVDKSIASTLSPLLPLELDRWFYDYQILEVSKKQTTVIAQAIMKTNLEDVGNVISEMGLIPAGIDSTFFNLINLYHNYLIAKDNEKKNVCIIYHGHQATTVAFFKGGILKASRIIQIGGLHFTNLIKEKNNLSDEEADKMKLEHDVFVADNPDLQNKNEIYNTIKPAFGDLIKGIYNSVDQYLARFREFKINEIILTGGGAAFRNIESALQANLNTKTVLGTEMTPIVSTDGRLTTGEALVLSCAVGSLQREE
jgi:type IV pilus assembly protein PilM